MHTFYDILGIDNKATQDEILAAYRRKIVQSHPDKGGDPIVFMNIRKAYKTLSDPIVRKKYDLWLDMKLADEHKKEWCDFLRMFVRKICTNDILVSHLDNLILSSSTRGLSKDVTYVEAAEIIKKHLGIIRVMHPNLKPQCIELDSVCNDVILGKVKLDKPHLHENVRSEKVRTTTLHGRFNLKVFIAIVLIIYAFLGFVFYKTYGRDNESKPISSLYDEAQENGDAQSADSYTYGDIGLTDYDETFFNTGDTPYLQYWGNGQFDNKSLSELSIINYSSTDAVVILETLGGKIVRHNFVSSGSTFTMKRIPSCNCRFKVMFGNHWNHSKDNGEGFPVGGFMNDVHYVRSEEIFEFEPIRMDNSINYPTYSITLHKVKNGNLQTENIEQENFFSN